ncbi:MAG: hypothetical protein JF606_29725 [Burkholderiales bacterium]|nr:hypothetical protein [Burkholderiales bacterium]
MMARGVLPIRSRLVPRSGNTNKLIIAGALVRVVAAIVPGARVLVDSWYMRGRFLLPLLRRCSFRPRPSIPRRAGAVVAHASTERR